MKEKDSLLIKYYFQEKNLEEYKENEKVISMYYEYIKKVIELFDFLLYDKSDLFYATFFNVLVHASFFTSDKNFIRSEENLKEVSLVPGISIINGRGVCRHISCFYADISEPFFDYPLRLCCLYNILSLDKKKQTLGNHVINLVKYHDQIYGFDMNNEIISKVISNNYLKGINRHQLLKYTERGDFLYYLRTHIKPDIDNDSHSVLNTKMLLQNAARYNFQNKNDILTTDDIKKTFNEVYDFIGEKSNILCDFKEQNAELTSAIKKKMLLLK